MQNERTAHAVGTVCAQGRRCRRMHARALQGGTAYRAGWTLPAERWDRRRCFYVLILQPTPRWACLWHNTLSEGEARGGPHELSFAQYKLLFKGSKRLLSQVVNVIRFNRENGRREGVTTPFGSTQLLRRAQWCADLLAV